jgi:hypothetical protein
MRKTSCGGHNFKHFYYKQTNRVSENSPNESNKHRITHMHIVIFFITLHTPF